MSHPLCVFQRRRARRLANVNGLVWALGNGLVSSTLVIYLAMELRAPAIGVSVALIRAAPQLAGVLRLGAPALIGRLADRKAFCIGAYLLSGMVLLAMPWLAAPGVLPSAGTSVAALVGLWCGYHLLEYLALVALQSWFADLVPARVRGRFFGRRDRWMVAGVMAGMLASGLFATLWSERLCTDPSARWIGYAIPAGIGSLVLMSAVIPLLRMPALIASLRTGQRPSVPWRALIDRRYLGLLAFGCWLSMANGISVPAQDQYGRKVLGLTLLTTLLLQMGMRLGQLSIGPTLGRTADRRGNKPVMMASLLVVATGPLFFFLASPQHPGWIVGAWIAWIAFAGLNVCLPNLLLAVSPRQGNTANIALYHTLSGLCMAGSTVLNGALSDLFADGRLIALPGLAPMDYYHTAFLLSWLARTLGVVVLWFAVREPSSRR